MKAEEAIELKTKMNHVKDNALIVHRIISEYNISINYIFEKIKSVQGIANKTNLLAINASIETIHASDLLSSFEQIVTKNLFVQARIIAEILYHDPDFMYQDGTKFATECGLEEFYITDDQGVVKFTNLPAWNNAKLNSSDIIRILKDQDLEIALPATSSGLDGEQFKVVGIGRKDQPGIIQIGAHFTKPKGQLAINGFGVVAQEAKRLADVSKDISSRITTLTNELGTKIQNLNQISNKVEADILALAEKVEKIIEVNGEDHFIDEEINLFKIKMSDLDNSVNEIRSFFKGILSPLSDLINIARQTNLLGVRAAIEAAHSTNDKQDFDNLLNKHMTAEAKLSVIYIDRRPDMTCEGMIDYTNYIGVDEVWISDANATVELTNIPGGKGFVYVNEGQTAPYLRLLSNPDLIVSEPPERRALDNKVFKYVGVGRKEKGGFLQVGAASKLYGESTAEGFSVVAKQIRTLAEQSRETTTEIQGIVEDMDFKARKAIDEMKTIQKLVRQF